MIVNTVVPPETSSPSELADPGTDEFAVAGRTGPNESRPEHSAAVDLRFVITDPGMDTVHIRLAQVGPDFAILPADHGVQFEAGTTGNVVVTIDGKAESFQVTTTTDIGLDTTRFYYYRTYQESVQVDADKSTAESTTTPEATTPVVTETTAVVESEQTGLSKAEQERLFWEEVRLLGTLRESESDRDVVETELITARGRQKELQAELNNLSSKIPQLEQDLEECCENTLRAAKQLWRLKQPASDQTSRQPAAIEPPASEQAALPAPAEESTEWRNLLTAELLAGIKGLGKKKLETICELAPTVGHLEDLRGQASREHKQYNEVLPDGCGAGVAQMIEDRLVKHIADCAKRSVGGNPLADELLNSFRRKVASESWQATDCVPDSNDTEQTHLGFAAFNEGKPHSALPTQNPELARQWMLGWVCAEVIKHSPPASESEASELAKQQQAETAPEPESKPSKKPRKPRAKKSK